MCVGRKRAGAYTYHVRRARVNDDRCNECGAKLAKVQCKSCPRLATSPGIFVVCEDCNASIHSLSTRRGHEPEDITAIKERMLAQKQHILKRAEDDKKKREENKMKMAKSKLFSSALASMED